MTTEPIAMTRLALIACFAASAAASASEELTVCASPMTAIPDAAPGSPAEAVILASLPANAEILSVRVALDVTHPWIGDLVATVSDGEATATLIDRIGFAGLAFGCGGDDIDAEFADGAAVTPEDLCAPFVAPNITGVVAPASPLGVFAGAPSGNPWIVRVGDDAPFDTGVLRTACVTIVYTLVDTPCALADVTTSGTDNGLGDGVIDLSDFSYYLARWAEADLEADITPSAICDPGTPDDIVDLSDFSCFLALWAEGCP